MKFTKQNLESLQATGTRYEEQLDAPGLIARVSAKGEVVLVYRYSLNGHRSKFTVGTFVGSNLDVLRKIYNDAVSAVSSGIDPQAKRVQERREVEEARFEDSNARSLIQVADEYYENCVHGNNWCRQNSPKTLRDKKGIINREIRDSKIANRNINDISRSDLVQLLMVVNNRGAKVMANRVRAFVSSMFNWAVDMSYIDVSPAVRLPSNGEISRTRVLSPSEVKKFWDAIDVIENKDQQCAIRALLLTGQRRNEIATVEAHEIEDGWWTIPEEKSKNGKAHRVYVSNEAWPYFWNDEGYVVKSSRANHINRSTLTHIVPEIAEAAGLEDVRCHDLRRTVATFIQGQFGSEVMDKVLNHQEQNRVTAAYGLYDFDKEKKAALIWWNNKLNEIVNGRTSKVVSIAA